MSETFTDDDLKQLKEAFPKHSNYKFQVDKQNDKWVYLLALLARLEAAETLLHAEWDDDEPIDEQYKVLLHKWRKACGK